jgi:hypothetical protein
MLTPIAMRAPARNWLRLTNRRRGIIFPTSRLSKVDRGFVVKTGKGVAEGIS